MGLQRTRLTLQTVEHIFQRHGWRYDILRNHIVTGFEGVPMLISVDEGREILLMTVPMVPGRGMQGYRPTRPEAERDTAVYLGAVNYRLALGAFTRDHHDGEIRYEVSVPVSGGILSDEQMEQILTIAVAAVTLRAPTINALLSGRTTLAQALAELDRGSGAPPAVAV
jgi:hypothetical protein